MLRFLIPGFLLTVTLLIAFAELVDEILEKETLGWDRQAYELLQQFSGESMDLIMYSMTFIGSAVSVVVLSVLMILWLVLRKRYLCILLFVVTNLGGVGFNLLLKQSFQRARPVIDEQIGAVGYSLPSGHAMGAMIFYGFLGYLLLRSHRNRWFKVFLSLVFLALIVLIGLSRVYLNAHYFSDVLAGFCAGSAWLVACILALEFPRYRRSSKS